MPRYYLIRDRVYLGARYPHPPVASHPGSQLARIACAAWGARTNMYPCRSRSRLYSEVPSDSYIDAWADMTRQCALQAPTRRPVSTWCRLICGPLGSTSGLEMTLQESHVLIYGNRSTAMAVNDAPSLIHCSCSIPLSSWDSSSLPSSHVGPRRDLQMMHVAIYS